MNDAPPIRIGVVDAHEPGLAAVRVRFPDLRDAEGRPVVSEPLPVLQPFGGAAGPRAYRLPGVGQQVAVAFTAAGGTVGPSAGIVLGAIYADADALPVDAPAPESAAVVMPDGTRVEYHPERGVTIEGAGDVRVTAAGKVIVDAADVYVGGEGGAEPIPLGRKLHAYLGQLVAWMHSHSHVAHNTPPKPPLFAASPPELSGHVHVAP